MIDELALLVGFLGTLVLLTGWVWTIAAIWERTPYLSFLIAGAGLLMIALILATPGFHEALRAF